MTIDFNHCERQFRSRRIQARRGMSLLEVTIGTMMVAVVTMMAASVSIDLTRGISQNVMRTRLATEARLAIESFRRDFGGSDPDRPEGDRSEWNLVDYRIPSEAELQLCYDSDADGSADWIVPDRVVTYTVDEGQLIRSDLAENQTIVIANSVESVQFEAISGEIRMELNLQLGREAQTYLFNTSDF